MSIITRTTLAGDVELARLLASAASCGWRAGDDLERVAHRCDWPQWLIDAVAQLPPQQCAQLVRASHTIWNVFSDKTGRTPVLRRLIGHPHLEVGGEDQPWLTFRVDSAGRSLIVTAALGLVDTVATHGQDSLTTCVWRSCTQPVVRVGRNSRSSACSPECANRSRVARHRSKSR